MGEREMKNGASRYDAQYARMGEKPDIRRALRVFNVMSDYMVFPYSSPLDYPAAGIIFYADIQKWQNLYAALLVKRMNQQKCRLYVKSGW